MKPIDLLKEFERMSGHSHTEKTLGRYMNEDVVTSYVKNTFGIIFLIKGKIKPFAFSIIRKELTNYYYDYNLKMVEVKDYFKLRDIAENETQDVVFNDVEKEKKIRALLLLNELNKGN